MSVWNTMWIDTERLRGFTLDATMLRRAWRFARPYCARLLGSLLLTAAGGWLQVLPAFVVQRLVDETLPSPSLAQVVLLAAVLSLVFIASSALHVGAAAMALRGSGMVLGLRRPLYDHLQDAAGLLDQGANRPCPVPPQL